MLASVVIPHFNRPEKLMVAIKSILMQNGSQFVEIVVVDDASTIKPDIGLLRSHDKYVQHDSNKGAAAARNTGLQVAVGDVIYFLDSDDYFIERDFVSDHKVVLGSDFLFYCDYKSGVFQSKFPSFVSVETYFNDIMHRNLGICITSSMAYSKHLHLKFDSSLPKHEDWDFVFFNFISKGITLKKIDGVVYIDRSDKGSLSRLPDYRKDLHWLIKLKSILSASEYEYVEYCILNKYPIYPFRRFMVKSLLYIYSGRYSLFLVFKRFLQRVQAKFVASL